LRKSSQPRQQVTNDKEVDTNKTSSRIFPLYAQNDNGVEAKFHWDQFLVTSS